MRNRKLITLLIGLLLISISSVTEAARRYDVSYLWHSSAGNVKAYQKRVARILGRSAAKRLRIVKKGKLYGLIYHYRGSAKNTNRIVRRHTKILRKRRMLSASLIRSQRWRFVGGARQPVTPVIPVPAAEDIEIVRDVEGGEEDYLTKAVANYVKKLRRKGVIAKDERTAWSVYDFATGKKLVSINEDLPLQSASLIKPFVALAYFHEVKRGKLKYDKRTRIHMRRMIHKSNNYSTNWVMRKIGGPLEVEALLRVNYPELVKDIHFVEYIPGTGRTYRNKASAGDYHRLLLAMWNDKIPGAKELKRLMALPGPDRLYTRTPSIPKGTKVYNKTGSTAHLCGDMGILVVRGKQGKRYAYSLVGIIEKQHLAKHYRSWIRSRGDVIRMVSNLVYRGIDRYHRQTL